MDVDANDDDPEPQALSDPPQFVGDFYGELYGPVDFPGFDEDDEDPGNEEEEELAENDEPLSGDEDDYM